MSRLTTVLMWLMGRGDEASCAEVGRHLQSYLDGHTDAAQVRRIEKHLERCRRCGLEARTYREIKSALSRSGAPADPAAAARLAAFGQSLLEGRGHGRGDGRDCHASRRPRGSDHRSPDSSPRSYRGESARHG